MLNNSPPLIFDNCYIDRVNLHKHLGIYLSSSLDWTKQIDEVCLKANRKLSVLRSVKLLSRQTLDVLYKLTVRSVVDYALPVYCNTLTQSLLARLENLQYRAAKLVTGTFHFTSREKLNTEVGWETIKNRSDNLSLNIFHKIHLHETQPLIRSCMPKKDIKNNHDTRQKGGYLPFKHFGLKFKNSFFPHTAFLWNNLPKNVRCKDVADFKEYINKERKPPRYKHFSRGSRKGNSLLTKIRVGRSDLNQHKFTIGLGTKIKKLFFPLHWLWNNLPKTVQCKDITGFKEYINKERKPTRHKHFSRGNKISNSLLTKIRVGRSDLNQHKFTIGLVDSPQCDCHFREESPSHYFLDCFLYLPERQVLFDLFEHFIPNFITFTKKKKLEIILSGINPENEELISTNTTLTIAVQNFIIHTNRFS